MARKKLTDQEAPVVSAEDEAAIVDATPITPADISPPAPVIVRGNMHMLILPQPISTDEIAAVDAKGNPTVIVRETY